MSKELAIIIPAYKSKYLEVTLKSITRQTSQDFVLYIGDDNSLEPIEQIIRPFEKKIDIVYHRFESNLGRTNLPAHWDRCIALSHEPLIWLFSDDDIMPMDSVERALKMWRESDGKSSFMRFPLQLIGQDGQIIDTNPPFTADGNSDYDYIIQKLSGKIHAAAIEYIFTRDLWKQANGFVQFPMAWCSDDASVVNFAQIAGRITNLHGEAVSWRNVEGSNISNSNQYNKQKLEATGMFMEWIALHLKSYRKDKLLNKAIRTYLHTILTISIQKQYTSTSLWTLCHKTARIKKLTALRVAIRHLFRNQSK